MDEILLQRLSQLLTERSMQGQTILYRDVANALGLEPPGQIQKIAELLEKLMQEDATRGQPFRSALVVGKPGIPRPGFFIRARSLGRYQGPPVGAIAEEWHRRELARLCAGGDPAETPKDMSP